MGNVNNCFTNPFEYDEVTIRPQQNVITDKSFNNSNSNDYHSRQNIFNRRKLDIINEEEDQETNMNLDKTPKENSFPSIMISQKENTSITSPKDIKIMENKFTQKFNNNTMNDNNNNNQNVMKLDNNVLLNLTRKSNNSRRSLGNNKYDNNKEKINLNNNMNNSENNFETNKLINSEDDSDNLIVLEYNKPEISSVNRNINVNNINGYSNSDDFNYNDINLDNIDNNTNLETSNDFNREKLINNNYKENNIDNINKINNIYINNKSNNYNNLNDDNYGPRDNIINNMNKKDKENILRNTPIRDTKNTFKSTTPYKKPRFNPNYNDKKNNTFINKKNIQNQYKENQNNNVIYYNNKSKNLIKPETLNIKINDNTNNIDISNKRFNNKIISDKYNTQYFQNNTKKDSNNYNFNSASRKFNSDLNNNEMPTQRQFVINYKKVDDDLIKYNRTNIELKNSMNNYINETNENECPISRNNKTNPNININPDMNKEITKIKNKKDNNDNNDNNNNNSTHDILPSKSQGLFKSKNEILNNNNEEGMSAIDRVLYQSATLDNIQEDNVLFHSASINNIDSDHLNLNLNQQEEIYSPMSQKNRSNNYDELGKMYDYSNQNENEQFVLKQPINRKEYDYNSIINQQKEQEKNIPEYEQTQQAQEEEEDNNNNNNDNDNNNEIYDYQQKIIAQVEHKEPKDKDSESDIDPKMQDIEPLTQEYQEIKQYINNNPLPMTNDRITFKKDDNNQNNLIDDEQDNNNNSNNNNNNLNKKKCKSKINSNNVLIPAKNGNNYIIEESNLEEGQFYENPLTPMKPTDEETPYTKKSFVNKIKDNNKREEINDRGDDRYNDIIENNGNIELDCEEFRDFNPESWEKFYSKDERFFKFPKEGITHDQIIIDKKDIYKGDVNRNKEKHGLGRFISPTIKRIGMWRRNNFTGWGREITENGDIFEGKFVNGKLNGKGIYKNKKNQSTYIGEFLNSKRHGKGELYTKEYHYKGDFSYNNMDGEGKIEIYNEGEYEGTFKDNQFDGKGMFKWKDGRYYIGEVSNGKMNGYGEETFSDGNIYKGYYVNGVKEGEGKVITPYGKVIKLIYKNGEKSIINDSNENNQ